MVAGASWAGEPSPSALPEGTEWHGEEQIVGIITIEVRLLRFQGFTSAGAKSPDRSGVLLSAF